MNNMFGPLLLVPDPRRSHKRLYPLDYLLLLVFTSTLSGCQSWYEIEDYALDHSEDLKRLYHSITGERLEHNTPCHDTINRAMSLLDVNTFEQSYRAWLEGFIACTSGQHICIDGKSMRGVKKLSFDSSSHTISDYSPSELASVAQVYINRKEGEINGIKLLIEKLDLQDSLVSIDAIGTQREIVQTIASKGGDYVLPLKNNQKHSLQEMERLFCPLYQKYIIQDKQVEMGHGRIETRLVESILNPLDVEESEVLSRWMKLSSVHRVTRTREDKKTGKESQEVAYYISSILDVEGVRMAIRKHWAIENQLHYMLDVYLGQDASEKRQGNVAQIMDMIQKSNLFIMNRLKHQKRSSIPRIQKFLSRQSPLQIAYLKI